MTVELSSRCCLAPSVHIRRFDDDVVILDLERGEYFGLDSVGADAIEGMMAGKDLAGIVQDLLGRYDVDEARLIADLLRLTRELAARGLIVIQRDPSTLP